MSHVVVEGGGGHGGGGFSPILNAILAPGGAFFRFVANTVGDILHQQQEAAAVQTPTPPLPPPVIPTPPATTTPTVGTAPRLPVGFPVFGARGIGTTGAPPPSPTNGGFDVARFVQCLIGSLSPATPRGATMPFFTTPGPQASSGGFDFGGFLGGAVEIAKRFLGPTVGPGTAFPGQSAQAGFPLLAPLTRFSTRALPALPAFGGGVVGGLVEDFFKFGGASDLDENAAFTDPIPGRCRPKAHVKINPCTNKGEWFVPRGKPLVFSGDMAACRRVDRVAKRLDKARPKRRHHHHTKHRPR